MKINSPVHITVQADEAGNRIDRFLSQLEEVSSRSYVQNLVDRGCVTVNGKAVKSSYKIVVGDQIQLLLPEVTSSELKPYDFNLDILHEDTDLLVVNKPAGLVVHPAAGHQQDTLVNALLHHTTELSMKNVQRPGIVHRIDKNTSGLLVVAKNDRAHDYLALQFKNKTAGRTYYALVDGHLPQTKSTCRSFLARHPGDRQRYASVRINNKVIIDPQTPPDSGKWAVTHFERIAVSRQMSYMKIHLETGRTHQIRVHMSELSHPLVGDTTYGYSVKKAQMLQLKRFFLHAAQLSFTHPQDHQTMSFSAPWPETELNWLREQGFSDADIAR